MITTRIVRHKFISMTILRSSKLLYATQVGFSSENSMRFAQEIAQEGNPGSLRYAAYARHFFANYLSFNTLRPRQNGRHFPDDIFKWNFLNENAWIAIEIDVCSQGSN